MRKIISQLANLLKEEEEKVFNKADLLQRRSSQIHFECSNFRANKVVNEDEVKVSEEEEEEEEFFVEEVKGEQNDDDI